MIEIPQDSFRLYFRDVCGVLDWYKLSQGDILCDESFLIGFLKHAIEQNLIWTMEHFDIFYKNKTTYDFNTPTEEEISYAIDITTQTINREVGEPGIPFQVFFRPVGENKWIWMPSHNCIVCDLNYIAELTQYGLKKGALSNLDRFDIYYKDSRGLPPKVDIDSLVVEIRRKAGLD